ncbi:O-antigen/teichoic acid export membrane protein [Breznakia blatticola]|uniref:O-antigen/teichoic acid export membrane protein n=1 Tax=Breznakia blatticola TaxID=1754012 RepID=A0A4R7Z973_9FIRM|nr:hypothetical protein [Breznakia blatticola]TDW13949.1 O-antigen/teichoic acid export membrane protein [Breznakia blatticola]
MRTKKALKNIVFNFIQQLIGIVVNFILPPLIIGRFGDSINGLVQTIRQMMQYAQLTGAGIGASSTYAMYKPLHEQNYHTLSGVYNATKKMFTNAGNLFTIIVLILSVGYPFFVEGIDFKTVALSVLVIGISGISEFYVYGKYQSIINANQDNYIIAIAQTIGNVANVVVSVILIYLNCNIVIVLLGGSVIYLLRILILTRFVRSNYQYLDPNVRPMMDLIDQRNDAIVHQISGLIVLSSSTIILSLMCGLEEASVYSVYALVFGGINTICQIVATAIYSSFGEVIVKGKNDVLKAAFNVYECLFFFAIFIVFTVAYVMIMPFISIYTNNLSVNVEYFLPLLGSLFVFVGIANNLRVPARTLVDAAGHFKRTRNRSVVEMIINLVGQIVFTYMFGIYGVLLGCLASYSYRTIDFILYTNKHIIKQSNLVSIRRIVVGFAASICMVLLLQVIVPLRMTGYVEWVIYGFIATFATSVVFFIIYIIFDQKTMKEIYNILKNILKKSN